MRPFKTQASIAYGHEGTAMNEDLERCSHVKALTTRGVGGEMLTTLVSYSGA